MIVRTRWLGRLFGILALWASVVVTSQAETKPAKGVDLPTVRVGIDLWPGYYPVVIAQQRGMFRQRGLRVKYSLPENTDKMLEEFVAGKLDVICVAMGDVLALKSRLPSLRVALISDESNGGDALVSLKPLPKNLKGLRIGTNLNGFGELFVRAFLEQKGVPLQDITLVNLEASNARIMLEQGKVDIAHTWEPYVSELTSYDDATVVFSSAQTRGLIPDAVVFRGDLLQRKALARAFVSGWLEAVNWWKAHRREGYTLVERALVMMPGTVNLEGIRLFDADDNRRMFQRGDNMQSIYFVARKYIDFFTEKGLLKTEITPDDLLDPDLLPLAVESDAISGSPPAVGTGPQSGVPASKCGTSTRC